MWKDMNMPESRGGNPIATEEEGRVQHAFEGVSRGRAWLDVGFVTALVYCVVYVLETRVAWRRAGPFGLI
jgi:hypothetical protein